MAQPTDRGGYGGEVVGVGWWGWVEAERGVARGGGGLELEGREQKLGA